MGRPSAKLKNLPVVKNKDEIETSRVLLIRRIGVVKNPSEIFEEFSSASAFYSLKNESEIVFCVGDAKYSSRFAGIEVIMSAQIEGYHEPAYLCRESNRGVFDFCGTIMLESWLRDVHDEVFVMSHGKEYLKDSDEFKEFMNEVKNVIES